MAIRDDEIHIFNENPDVSIAIGDSSNSIVLKEMSQFPEDMKPEVGMRLNMTNGDGHVIPVVITDVKEESVMLDANHPLAGEALVFDIELVEIAGKPPLIIMP